VAYTVLANTSNCMDACSLRSRQSSDDAAAPDADCCETVRSLRTIRTQPQVRVRPHAHCAASDTGCAGWVGTPCSLML
jgi:hypothetical protein